MSLFFENLTNKQTLKVQTSHYFALLEPNLLQTALQPTLIRFPYHWVCDIQKEKPNINYKKKEKRIQNKSGTQTSRNEAPEAAGDCSAGRLRVKSIHYKRHRTNNV